MNNYPDQNTAAGRLSAKSRIFTSLACGAFLSLVLGGMTVDAAVTAAPAWFGEAGSTSVCYTFSTNEMVPVSTSLVNPHGAPAPSIVLGSMFPTGWQDPTNVASMNLSATNSGSDGNGSWDLGSGGFFEVTLPVASVTLAPGQSYRIEFEAHGVAYFGITALPSFSTVGGTPDSAAQSNSLYSPDPMFGGASWQAIRYTGVYESTSLEEITLRLTAPGNNTSVIDAVAVYTRVSLVPEPSAILMLTISGLVLIGRRRRLRGGE